MDSKGSNDSSGDEYPTSRGGSRGSRGQGGRSKNNGSTKFTGLNKDELEGIVICENVSTPTAQQFDALYEALIVYGGSRNGAVRTSLRTMRYINKEEMQPTPPSKASYLDDDGKVDTILQQARMEVWKKECEDANKDYNKYRKTLANLFEVIQGQLGLEIKNNLKASDDWQRIDDETDTIGLITTLKDLCYRDNNNKVDIGVDLINKMLRFLQIKQNDKSAAQFAEDVSSRWDVIKSIGGSFASPGWMKYVLKTENIGGRSYTYEEYLDLKKSTAQHDINIVNKIEDTANQMIVGRVIVLGSNDKNHQNLRFDLMKDFAKGRPSYPKNASEALKLLNQFKSKPQHQQQRNGNSQKNKGDKTSNKGHRSSGDNTRNNSKGDKSLSSTGEDKDRPGLTPKKTLQLLLKGVDKDEDSDEDFMFLQFGVEQGNDGQTNEDEEMSINDYPIPTFADEVTNTDEIPEAIDINTTAKPRSEQSEEEYNALKRRSASAEKDEIPLDEDTDETEMMDTMDMTKAYLFAQNQGDDIVDKWWLLLDSQASCNIICNPKLVKNIRKHPEKRSVRIHCNAGSVVVDTVADLAGLGMVWFSEECIANCLSLALVSDKFRVTLDTGVTQGFFVHREDGSTRRFDRDECDLYVCDLKNEDHQTMLVTTVKGQKEFYSDLDVRRAKAARKLQETMGFPSNKAFIHMINNNMIKNCAVTKRDIIMAEDIFGVNTNIIKGKTVRRQPRHVREDLMTVPGEILERYKEVTLGIDVYHINGIRFFRSISRHLMFRVTQPIADAKAKTLFKQVQRTAGRYALRGFKVVQIYGDNAFNCIADRLASELGISFVPVAPDAHEPFIERDNRTSKERCRCIYNALPFNRMPPRMVMELPVAVDYWLNYWCSSGGVSKTMPPRQIMTGITLDASKHCRFQFGDYVLAHNETDNTMKARASDSIYLRPTGTPDGAFFVFDLKTARRVRKHAATAAHMTDSIIKRVHAIAESQNAPVGLTFGDINNNVTILDIDTKSIGSEADDDDASDASYQPPDDESVDTTLTGVTNTSESEPSVRSESGYNADTDTEQDGNYEPQGDNPGTDQETNVEEESIHGAETNEEETIVFYEENDEDDAEEQVEIVHPNLDDTRGDDNSTEEPRGRMTLRESVTRSHPKYGAEDGFTESTRHRILFCKGYEQAVKKIADDHAKIVLVSQAVEQYNALEASKVTPQYGVRKGLEIFGEDGAAAVLKELKQLHDLTVVSPVHPRNMTKEEIKRALPYLMFLKRKRCGKIKGRGCADGRSQRDFISKEEASSPTASLYAIMLTCLIDAIEGRYTVTTDIPGAFLQTDMPEDEVVHIRITGAMADLMCEIDPDLYGPCIATTKRGTKVLYAKANKAIYGTLRAALLFWEKLRGKLIDWGFEENQYDACTMNKMINGSQATVVWHVDDLKISHIEKEVVESIITDLENEFGNVAPLTTTRGDVHDYLGMTIDYSKKGRVKFTMFDYLNEIIESLPDSLRTNRNTTSPAADHLFDVSESAKKLSKHDADIFHSYVAKLLFAAKRARPDIQTAVAFLCTRVKEPDEDDWKKLQRVLGYIAETVFLPLTIGWDGTGNIYWYVDASFAVHNNMRSHTGAVMTFGVGAAMSMSTKQKINTKSSTEAELVGVDDSLPFNIWCLYFLQGQGYVTTDGKEGRHMKFLGENNILYQDNTSSIKLEMNGKASSTKRTRHINIRYFLVTDKIKRGEITTVEYCPTEDMIADYFTKPLQGSQFRRFRNAIMGLTDAEYLAYKLEYDKARARDKAIVRGGNKASLPCTAEASSE